jgi:hypothetical protein
VIADPFVTQPRRARREHRSAASHPDASPPPILPVIQDKQPRP